MDGGRTWEGKAIHAIDLDTCPPALNVLMVI